MFLTRGPGHERILAAAALGDRVDVVGDYGHLHGVVQGDAVEVLVVVGRAADERDGRRRQGHSWFYLVTRALL